MELTSRATPGTFAEGLLVRYMPSADRSPLYLFLIVTSVTPAATAMSFCVFSSPPRLQATYNADAAPSYPGQSSLMRSAAYQCPTLFLDYVGIDFGSSKLDILPVVPTEIAWAAGTRAISCLAITTDGSKRTESVRGTHQ